MTAQDFLRAQSHLAATDRILAGVIATHALEPITPHQNYYYELASSIISQQLSVKAAATIERRFVALFPGSGFPSPEAILSASTETLRTAGLSGQKAGYIQDLAAKVLSGEVQFDHLDALPNEEIIRELTAVKGIGEWTAHMFLIFCMARLDVLPVGDLGIRNGITKLYGLSAVPTPAEVTAIADANGWHPYESVASRYIWKSLDNEPKS